LARFGLPQGVEAGSGVRRSSGVQFRVRDSRSWRLVLDRAGPEAEVLHPRGGVPPDLRFDGLGVAGPCGPQHVSVMGRDETRVAPGKVAPSEANTTSTTPWSPRAKEHRNGLEPNARRRSEAGLGSLVPRHGMSAALLAASSLSCSSPASPRSRPPCAGGSRVPAGWS
jgi:hypothetical protein